jgi:hypothetical protein
MNAIQSTKVKVSDVIFERSIYPRVINKKGLPFWAMADRYYLAMKAGNAFPPIALAPIKGKLVLVDGMNRLIATKRLGLEEIEAEVLEGCTNYDDAYIEALARNTTHGATLTPYEIATAIRNLKKKGASWDVIARTLHIPTESAQKMLRERVVKGVVIKRIAMPVKERATDSNQRTLSAKNQLSLINELITILKNDLLDLSNKKVIEAVSELKELIERLTVT